MKQICYSQIDLEKVRLHLLSLSLDKPVVITIEEYVRNRSGAQNRLMHMWFNKISEHCFFTFGKINSPEEWKEWFKEEFLGFDVMNLPNGKTKDVTKKTSDCNVNELTTFLEKIDFYAVTELELLLPKPDDIYWEAMGITK